MNKTIIAILCLFSVAVVAEIVKPGGGGGPGGGIGGSVTGSYFHASSQFANPNSTNVLIKDGSFQTNNSFFGAVTNHGTLRQVGASELLGPVRATNSNLEFLNDGFWAVFGPPLGSGAASLTNNAVTYQNGGFFMNISGQSINISGGAFQQIESGSTLRFASGAVLDMDNLLTNSLLRVGAGGIIQTQTLGAGLSMSAAGVLSSSGSSSTTNFPAIIIETNLITGQASASANTVNALRGDYQIVNLGAHTNMNYVPYPGQESNVVTVVLFTQNSTGGFYATNNGTPLMINTNPSASTYVQYSVAKGVTNADVQYSIILTNPAAGQTLSYDIATGAFRNSTGSSGAAVGGNNAVQYAKDGVPFGTNNATQKFAWDETNNRLIVGNTTSTSYIAGASFSGFGPGGIRFATSDGNPSGLSTNRWEIGSTSGNLIPGGTNTYGIGSNTLPASVVYTVNLSVKGASTWASEVTTTNIDWANKDKFVYTNAIGVAASAFVFSNLTEGMTKIVDVWNNTNATISFSPAVFWHGNVTPTALTNGLTRYLFDLSQGRTNGQVVYVGGEVLLAVKAGGSSSNGVVAGTLFKGVTIPAYTNLNTTIATFTNAFFYINPAHTLTNTGDSVITTWRGDFLVGTNNLKLIYGVETVLDTGAITNATGGWEAVMEVTRTGASAAYANGTVKFTQASGTPLASGGIIGRTVTLASVHGSANTNLLQIASNRAGAVSNNFMRVVYEPASR